MIPMLGGVHWLMSFAGSIGVLMKNSGLVSWWECAFTGVPKKLTRRKFPMNVCALKYIVMELLRGTVDGVTSFGALQEKLDNISQENIWTEHWMKNLIKPVLQYDVVYTCRGKRKISFTPLCL